MRALLGDPPVHRQGTEEGQKHDEKGSDRRENTGGERGYARDVSKG